jgi:hypothetical protein
MHHIVGFVLFSAAAMGISASREKSKIRPMLRSLVKSGIVAKRKLDAYRAVAVSEAEKLVAEARAEVDKPKTEQEA